MSNLVFVPDGNILRTRIQTLVCPVNTIGVMGAGLAKYFTSYYPALLHHYRDACKTKALTIDKLWVYKHSPIRQILCFPTKIDWRDPSKLEWIEAGMKRLVEQQEALGIYEIAIPQLGCGKGQLDWKEVGPIVVKYAEQLLGVVYIFGEEPKNERVRD